jgi:hypothetical protein
MLQALVTTGTLRFRWVTCDEAFGRDGAFLDGVAALRRWYFAEVPHDTQVWLSRPATAVPPWRLAGPARPASPEHWRRSVDQLAAVPPDAWQAFLIKEGSKGPWRVRLPPRRSGTRGLAWPRRVDRVAADLGEARSLRSLQ